MRPEWPDFVRMFQILMSVNESSVCVLSTLLSGSKPEMRRVLVKIDKWKSIFYLSFSSLRWLSVSLSRDGIVRRVGLLTRLGVVSLP